MLAGHEATLTFFGSYPSYSAPFATYLQHSGLGNHGTEGHASGTYVGATFVILLTQ